jgi:hypothetical protein
LVTPAAAAQAAEMGLVTELNDELPGITGPVAKYSESVAVPVIFMLFAPGIPVTLAPNKPEAL